MSTNATISDVAESTNFTAKLAHLVRRWPGTQKALAAKIGIKPQMLSEYMRGVIPKPHVIRLLAEELGVISDLSWLLDEGDKRLEPPRVADDVLLEVAPDRALIEELRHRYIKVALDTRYQLETIDGIAAYESDYWQKMALDLAFSDGETERNHQAVVMVENFMKLIDRAKRLWACASFDGTKIGLADAKREGYALKDLHLDSILQYADEADEESPGLRFIFAYINARVLAKDLGNEAERHEQFFRIIAPFHVASIACHSSMADDPQRDAIIKQCKEKGYLTDDGKPVQIPDFIPWLPDDVEMEDLLDDE